jgi:hypothetical protein
MTAAETIIIIGVIVNEYQLWGFIYPLILPRENTDFRLIKWTILIL